MVLLTNSGPLSERMNIGAPRWLKEQSHKATIEMDKAHLRWLDRHLGGKHLDTIGRGQIDGIAKRSSWRVCRTPR